MKKILAFAGSNSSTSINKVLATCAAKMIKGHEVFIIDLRDYEAPVFSVDLEKKGFPKSIQELNKLFNEYDAFIIATPEYNSFLTPVLVNLVDWVSRIENPTFRNKPVLLLSTSEGKRGAKSALAYLEQAMERWGGKVVGAFSLPQFSEHMDRETATLSEEEKRKELKASVQQLEASLS